MASLAGPCSNVVERWRGGESAPVSVSISAPARTAIVSSLRAGAPLPMIRFALCSATRELLIVIFRLSLMAPSPDDSCDVKKIVSPDARVCTGRGFAMMEATQLLAALARRFCLRLRRVPGVSDVLRSLNGTASKCKTFLATATEECCPARGTLAGHFTRRLSPSPMQSAPAILSPKETKRPQVFDPLLRVIQKTRHRAFRPHRPYLPVGKTNRVQIHDVGWLPPQSIRADFRPARTNRHVPPGIFSDRRAITPRRNNRESPGFATIVRHRRAPQSPSWFLEVSSHRHQMPPVAR